AIARNVCTIAPSTCPVSTETRAMAMVLNLAMIERPGASGPVAAEPVRRSPLTAREQEVAALLTRGLSNRGIAAELVISPATVARHIANIMEKLGYTSRAQIAVWAAEHSGTSA
ncbi:helix-turn-helix transcriptional regulator, partial [Nonomuraea sp. NPDC005983]|uniref:response regulator transcription factor n=1 Tax=Nonomuraea sp. NPDC005983 TaxID=3155595 RepID=UPI0033B0DD23